MLYDWVSDPKEKVIDYLRLCSTSRQMMLGTLHFSFRRAESAAYRCEGATLRARTTAEPPWLLLRLRHRELASSRYVALNRRLGDLTREMRLRQQAEHERADLLLREQQARAEAERLNHIKDEFLATLSHELRTPLNAILGWAQILQKFKPDPETVKQALQTIEQSALTQARLIDDLLDVSRIMAGKLSITLSPLDVRDVVEAALDLVRPGAAKSDVALYAELPEHPVMVRGEQTRLQQVVWNLLTNALKFTPAGGRIMVRLQVMQRLARISVTDTGQGIAPEFLPFVFERFRQADSSVTRGHGGLGLGLALVRQLVELQGGQVTVTSPGTGQGATFTVELPLANRPSVGHGPEDAATPVVMPQLDGALVMVVDDEAVNRDLICCLLEARGASTVATGSVAETLHNLEHAMRLPDVVISDIGMPGQDGYDLLRLLRQRSAKDGGAIPAIALTAYARPQDQEKAFRSGFQAHLSKPVDTTRLIMLVDQLVRHPDNHADDILAGLTV